MSKYTTQLRWPLEQIIRDTLNAEGKAEEAAAFKPVMERYWPLVYERFGLHDYPIFDEEYRVTLNNLIIREYFYSEIGAETLGQFAWHLRSKMHLIMPYYNKLYRAVMDTTPLDEIDMRFTNDTETDSTADSTAESESSTIGSDTPMGMLKDDQPDPNWVKTGKYATAGSFSDGIGKNSAKGHAEVDQDGTEKGHRTGVATLIRQYSDNLMNIDMRVVEDVHSCFMGLW